MLVSTPQSRLPMPATAALALMHPELQLQQRLALLAQASPVTRP